MQPAGVPYDQEVEPAAGKSMTQDAAEFDLRLELELSCSPLAGSDGLKADVKVSPKELHNGPRALPLKHMERRLRQRACVTNQEAAGGLYTI